jgi:hypothetical protein
MLRELARLILNDRAAPPAATLAAARLLLLDDETALRALLEKAAGP